jgi:hypothetical protein
MTVALINGSNLHQTNPSDFKNPKDPEGNKMKIMTNVTKCTELYFDLLSQRQDFAKNEAKEVCKEGITNLNAQIAALKAKQSKHSSACSRLAAAIAIFLVGTLIFN